MDAFECHNMMTHLLSLNISSARIVKQIIQFCYEQVDNSEVVYQAILDFLQESVVMKRLTIFYLVDALVKQDSERVYSKQIIRNLKEIVDLTVDYQVLKV